MHKCLTDVSTHRHFNPLFPMKTFQPLDTSTLTCSDISSHVLNTYLLLCTFSTSISKSSQTIYRRHFNPCQTYFHR